jgi:hypothetical protein
LSNDNKKGIVISSKRASEEDIPNEETIVES